MNFYENDWIDIDESLEFFKSFIILEKICVRYLKKAGVLSG